MTRTRKPSPPTRRTLAGEVPPGVSTPWPPGPTPVPPAELAACAVELRALVDELAGLTSCGSAWSVRVLRRNLELALLNPHTLRSAENQLDFIEELAEAVWDGAVQDGSSTSAAALTAQERIGQEERRRLLLGRLDELTHGLCGAAEAWWELAQAAPAAGRTAGSNPQEDHRP